MKKRESQTPSWLLPLALSSGFLVPSGVGALPQEKSIVSGSVDIDRSAKELRVNQSSNEAIVEWYDFNVARDEVVKFELPSSSSKLLNRILAGSGSQIDGTILSNDGHLFLVNPSGISFGTTSKLDVHSISATTIDVADANFLSSNSSLFGRGFSGNTSTVVNQGEIRVSESGYAALIGAGVENTGSIVAQTGKVFLVATNEFVFDPLGDGLIYVSSGDHKGSLQANRGDGSTLASAVSNSGQISAEGGTVSVVSNVTGGVFSRAINLNGLIDVGSETLPAGQVKVEGQSAVLDGDILALSADGEGGSVSVNASDWLSIGGKVDVSGRSGGQISVNADRLSLAGSLRALGRANLGSGGEVAIDSKNSFEFSGSLIDASGTIGGNIRHVASEQIVSSGTYSAIGYGGVGGKVDMSASAMKLLSLDVDVSGFSGGGRIRIGGEYQGGVSLAADELFNAKQVGLDDGVVLRANVTGEIGDGGRIITWADERLFTHANYQAKPGSKSGSGGFVEIASLGSVAFDFASLDTGFGDRKGEVLIDHKTAIVIDDRSALQQEIIFGFNYTSSPGGSSDSIYVVDIDEGVNRFGTSVSIDGNRLAVSSFRERNGNEAENGTVYLYTFSTVNDNAFSNIKFAAAIGEVSTGRGNSRFSLGANDRFGSAVSLSGNILAVGSPGDDGLNDAYLDAGAVHLFNVESSSEPYFLSTIGRGYAGFDANSNLETTAGLGNILALDGDDLVVGDALGKKLYVFDYSSSNGGIGGEGRPVVSSLSGLVLDPQGEGSIVSVDVDGQMLIVGYSFSSSERLGGGVFLLEKQAKEEDNPPYAQIMEISGRDGRDDESLFEMGTVGSGFGISVALDGELIAIGEYDLSGYGNSPGQVYILSAKGGDFSSVSVIKHELTLTTASVLTAGEAVDGGAANVYYPYSEYERDKFSSSLSMDAGLLVVGAPNRLSYKGSISNDSQISNESVGSVYLFSVKNTTGYVGLIGDVPEDGFNGIKYAAEAGDGFGSAVSHSGNLLAIGAPLGDGFGNSLVDSGVVYLLSFSDPDSLSSVVFEGAIGSGFTGGKNIDISDKGLRAGDGFGTSVSISRNLLAVGAPGDTEGTVAGSVYLFTFGNDDFSGGALNGKLVGPGEARSDNTLEVRGLSDGDDFGFSVSLDFDKRRIAVGAPGHGSEQENDVGAVYFFTFADSQFGNLAYEDSIGLDSVSYLGAGDRFGASLTLQEDSLVVGAPGDDGANNDLQNAGAVHLYSLVDGVSNSNIIGTLGFGYSFERNSFGSRALSAGDEFGTSVALNSSYVLAVGAPGDDGTLKSSVFSSGAELAQFENTGSVYVFDFAKPLFTDGMLLHIYGSGYVDDATPVDLSSGARFGTSVSLWNNTLAVGSPNLNRLMRSDNSNSIDSAVYLFSFEGAGSTVEDYGSSALSVSSSLISQLLSSGNNVRLQANNDIDIRGLISVRSNSVSPGNLSLVAGRSIVIKSGISTGGGNFSLVGNASQNYDIASGYRDVGIARISMLDGSFITANSGSVNIRLDDGGNRPTNKRQAGDISLSTVTADTIHSINDGVVGNNLGIVLNGNLNASSSSIETSLVIKGSRFINNSGAKSLVVDDSSRFLVWTEDPTKDSRGGLAGTFKQYGAIFGETTPAQSNGNGFLYSVTPKLTLNLSAVKSYDGNRDVALSNSDYSISSAIDGDVFNVAYGQFPTQGVFNAVGPGDAIPISPIGDIILPTPTNSEFEFIYGEYNYDLNSFGSIIIGTFDGDYRFDIQSLGENEESKSDDDKEGKHADIVSPALFAPAFPQDTQSVGQISSMLISYREYVYNRLESLYVSYVLPQDTQSIGPLDAMMYAHDHNDLAVYHSDVAFK